MIQPYIELLSRNRAYRYLWLGNVVSLVGDWFNLIASASLVARLSDAGTAISGLFLARFLPLFLFAPLAGVLADRFDRRRLMIFSNVARAIIVGCFLLVREPEQLWLLYVLIVLQFSLSAIFTPARSAVLANVVRREDLVTANALDAFTWSTMLAMGALLGGIVATLFGLEVAFLADVGTFLISTYFIWRVVVPEELKQTTAQRTGFFAFVDGIRYLTGRPILTIIVLVKAAGSLVWGAYNVLEVSFASDIFRIGQDGTASLGFIFFFTGLGTGVGPLVMRRILGDAKPRLFLGIGIGYFLLTVGIFGTSAAPVFWIFLLFTLVRTLGTGTLWVFSAALLQLLLPDRYRGRVFSLEFTLLTAAQSLSIFWAGFAEDSLDMGVRTIAAGMGMLGAVVLLLWLGFDVWRRRYRPVVTADT